MGFEDVIKHGDRQRATIGVQQSGNVPAQTFQEPQQAPEPESALGHAFDILSRPGYSTVGPIYESLKSYQDTGAIDWGKAVEGFTSGLKGKQYMTTHILHALDVHKSLQQHMSPKHAEWMTMGLGFVGDVVTDWSNLVGVGAVRAAVKGAAKNPTAKAMGLMAQSKVMTGMARMFDAGFGFPGGYHDIKYFARHALGGELSAITQTAERLAKEVPSLKDRNRIMEQLAKPGPAPADWSDEAKSAFGELRTRIQDIGQKWVDGGWMRPEALVNAEKSGFRPRYYLMYDSNKKKWIVDNTGAHGIPGSIFDKGGPAAAKRRVFDSEKAAKEYYTKLGIYVEDIDEIPNGLKEGIAIGKDPIYGYGLRATAQARFMAQQHFTDNVLEKFGTRIDAPGEILDEISQGSLAYKARKLGADEGFFLPKGSLKFFTNTMVDNKDLRKLIKAHGVAVHSAKGKQLPEILKTLGKDMKKQGFSDGEIALAIDMVEETGGLATDMFLKDVEAMRDVIRRLGVATEGPLLALEEFEKVAAGLGKRMVGLSKKVPVYKLPKSIAQDMNKLRFVETDEGAKMLRNAFDKTMNVWKGYATAINPGFHFRNSYSNWFNMFLADVNPVKMPQRIKQAMHVQRKGTGKLTDDLSYEQILEEVDRLGVRGRGWMAADIPSTFTRDMEKALKGGKATLKERLNPVNQEFELMAKGRALGTAVEDNSRIALYLDRRIKGATPHEAALAVRKYLFDYSEITDVERNVFKRVFPFYTWMRKNTPLQFEHLITKPYKYSAVAKGFRNIGLVDPETETERAARPDYFNELEAVKVPLQNAFKDVPFLGSLFKSDHPLYLNPNFPFQDINRVEIRDLLASLNPFIKMSIELAPISVGQPGWEAFSRRPLYKYPGERDALPPGLAWLNDLPDPIKDIVGVGPTLDLTEGREVPGMDARLLHVVKNLNPFFMNMARAVPEMGTGQAPAKFEDRRKYHILSWMLGIKLMPLDVAKSQMIKTLQSKKELANIRKYIKYESPSDGKIHNLLQEWEQKHFPDTAQGDRLKKVDRRAKDRSSLLGR